jgi:hypothetical protein
VRLTLPRMASRASYGPLVHVEGVACGLRQALHVILGPPRSRTSLPGTECGTRRFQLLITLHDHTETPHQYKPDLLNGLWKTLRARERPGRARTGVAGKEHILRRGAAGFAALEARREGEPGA